MIDADTAWHRAIYEASGNPLLLDSAMLDWIDLRRVMGAVLRHHGGRKEIWDEHEAIRVAIGDGQAELAAKLSERHAAVARRS